MEGGDMGNCLFVDNCRFSTGECRVVEDFLSLECPSWLKLKEARCYICKEDRLCFESKSNSPFCLKCARDTVFPRRLQMGGTNPTLINEVIKKVNEVLVQQGFVLV